MDLRTRYINPLYVLDLDYTCELLPSYVYYSAIYIFDRSYFTLNPVLNYDSVTDLRG